MAEDPHSNLYGKFRAAILARHFAVRPHFRTNQFTEGNVILTFPPGQTSEWVANQPEDIQQLCRWNIRDDSMGASNPLLYGGMLMTCLAVEYALGRSDALMIIKLLLQTLSSLFKFSGNDFDGYILRYDAVTNGGWKLDNNNTPLLSLAFPIGQDGRYTYAVPLNDPRYMRPFPSRYDHVQEPPNDDLYDPARRYQFKFLCRAAEASEDELVGLITGYFMIHHLVQDQSVQDEVKRQATNLGNYLAAHGYLLVRPSGGLNGHAMYLLRPAQRVFQRIAGALDPNAFAPRVDFVGALQQGDVWHCVEVPFDVAVLGTPLIDAILLLLGAVLGPVIDIVAARGVVDAIIGALGGSLLAGVPIARAMALSACPACFDSWKNGAGEFALAYVLSLIPAPLAHTIWMVATSKAFGGVGSAISFPPYFGLTGIDDPGSGVAASYLDWLPNRRSTGKDQKYPDGASSLFASAVAVVLGAGAAEEQVLAANLVATESDYHNPNPHLSMHNSSLTAQYWVGGDRLPLADVGSDVTEGARWPMDYMVAVALAWLHVKRQAEQGAPVTTPGFPSLPDPSSWPNAIVPNNVIDTVKQYQISLPLNAIQNNRLVQDSTGANLFLDPVPRSPEPPPVLPSAPTQSQVRFDSWITVPESQLEVDTGVTIRNGDIYSIVQATGEIWSGVWVPNINNGPNGWEDTVQYDPKFPYHGFSGAFPCQALGTTQPSHPFGLIGKLTNYFFIGDCMAPVRHFADPEIDRNTPFEPHLILRTNDDTPGNGNGAFQCHLRVLGVPQTAKALPPSAPVSILIGQSGVGVVVQMQNTGPNKWLCNGLHPYRLGSQRPQDSLTWGLSRVELRDANGNPTDIWPGDTATFRFQITAPSIPGNYDFCWRMVQEYVEWFGDFTTDIVISVIGLPLIVRATPFPMPLNTPVQATISVTNTGGTPLAGTVTITNPGATPQTFPTNTAFSFTFRTKLVPPGGTVHPLGEVTVPGGYLITGIDFGWPPDSGGNGGGGGGPLPP
jgi:hypothetical protein